MATSPSEVARPITFRLSQAQVLWSVFTLLVYLLVGAGAGVACFLFPLFAPAARALACAAAIALAAAASSYLRKLYKAGIARRIDAAGATWSERLGSQLYVLARPLMAALMALVAAMALIVNFYGSAPDGTEPTDGIVHIASLIGFSIGALSSKVLKEVEESGRVPA